MLPNQRPQTNEAKLSLVAPPGGDAEMSVACGGDCASVLPSTMGPPTATIISQSSMKESPTGKNSKNTPKYLDARTIESGRIRTCCPKPMTAHTKFKLNQVTSKSFPMKLYKILTTPEFAKDIAWVHDGQAWKILNQTGFETNVIPKFFSHRGYHAFLKQARRWGFEREGIGMYSHELFSRDNPDLIKAMIPIQHLKRHDVTSAPNNAKQSPLSTMTGGLVVPVFHPGFLGLSDAPLVPNQQSAVALSRRAVALSHPAMARRESAVAVAQEHRKKRADNKAESRRVTFALATQVGDYR